MTHLFGIPMDNEKILWKALVEIPGIGKKTAFKVCNKAGLVPYELWGNLQPDHKKWINNWLKQNIAELRPLGTEYWRERRNQRKALISLGSYRGIRRRQGFPVRGQNTHSNARTCKKIKILLYEKIEFSLF